MGDMQKKKHFVLVHGACHGAWCWYKVAAILESAGHRVTALDLAGSGIHPKKVEDIRSANDYFQPLMEFMRSLPLQEKVVLVGHSMGGLSISVAMERFASKVSAGVFISAVMPGPDLTYPRIRQEYARRIETYMDTTYTYNDDNDNPPTSLLFGPNLLSARLYQLSPPEDLVLAKSLLRPHPLFNDEATQRDTKLTKGSYGVVPKVYVVCQQDKIVTEELQRWIIENNPTNEVKVIASDHMVMFSRPQELCSCLQETAEQYS